MFKFPVRPGNISGRVLLYKTLISKNSLAASKNPYKNIALCTFGQILYKSRVFMTRYIEKMQFVGRLCLKWIKKMY